MSPHDASARVLLISHPATREQKAGVFPLDEPLDARALADLAAVRWSAPRSTRVVVSPELRTRQSAEALGLAATEAAELRECDFSRWRGRALESLPVEELLAWLQDVTVAPHGGESFHGLMLRVGGWLDAQRNAGTVLALTHASVVRAAVVWALQGLPDAAFLRIEVAPLTLTDLRFSGGHWRVRSVGVPLVGGDLD
jgi:broad specificity phosphatase PhoE